MSKPFDINKLPKNWIDTAVEESHYLEYGDVPTNTITRVVLVDYTRSIEQGAVVYEKLDKDMKVELSLQDNSRTLKIFINK